MALTFDLNQPAPFDQPTQDRPLDAVIVIMTPAPSRPAASRLRALSPEPADHSPGLSPAEREAVTWQDAEWR